MTFDELCASRAKKGEAKYQVWECGKCGHVSEYYGSRDVPCCPKCLSGRNFGQFVNAAMHRDNALDVAEELADACNIIDLWEQRLGEANKPHQAMMAANMKVEIKRLANLLVPFLEKGRDDYPVERD